MTLFQRKRKLDDLETKIIDAKKQKDVLQQKLTAAQHGKQETVC